MSAPVPQSGAPCGVVDLFDFPLNPPDGDDVAFGGLDFGVFRSNYDGFHTGEDWWGRRGGASFGMPVYSIAHGMVTYADPLGWGADKGVVIVRHIFADGRSILSSYGHLDPPSVVLNVGDCVARGDPVGRIGRPRSPPHLHFEIRTHMPNAPGPGYWSTDPTLAGWKPPSQYIWNHRIAASPGVEWVRSFVSWGTKGLGMLDPDTFVAIEDQQLVGIDVLDGNSRWSQPSTFRATDGIMDVGLPLIYVINFAGWLEAFQLSGPQDGGVSATSDSLLTTTWKIDLDAIGPAILMPLPGGGVVASFRQKMFGVSPAGELLWERDSITQAFDWTFWHNQLIFSTLGSDGSIWRVDESGPLAWTTSATGHLLVVGDRILIYGEDGVYRLDPETLSADLLYALPEGLLRWNDIVALPDGSLLLTHMDRFDKRLIALNSDGTLRWQRSYSAFVPGYEQRLLVLDGRPYLLAQRNPVSANEVSVLAIDLDGVRLTRIFTAGSRNPLPEDTWTFAVGGDLLLVNIGGGGMVVFDAQLALETILQTMNSQ